MPSYTRASTGLTGLDDIFDGLRLGDNVVWQVDSIGDYRTVVDPYVTQALADGHRMVYVRFADHKPLVAGPGVVTNELDARAGFESFATQVHQLVADEGIGAYYVFDSLTHLLRTWHSDLAVGNFFKVTCPFLFELDTIAYFALERNAHTFDTIAAIRDTTQLLLDLYHVDARTYVHPLKVWLRHSPTMFFPHLMDGGRVEPITSSGASARLFSLVNRQTPPPDHWQQLVQQAADALRSGDPDATARGKEQLITMLMGREGRMIDLCRRHLDLADLLQVAGREIGTGFIGGKSVGMLVARAILEHDEQARFASHLEPHDSFYLGSDLFYSYIIANGWWRLWIDQKTRRYFEAGEELHAKLTDGRFPPDVRDRFMTMLEYFGQSPIIVRSSSLLEDNFGNAFAGKYESVFCANQGTPEQRHRALEDAVRTVYASAMSAEALHYRRNRGLDGLDEQMAILVQRVSGDHHGEDFFPHAGGVGNSKNLYVWSPEIDPDAGMLRIVVGLGTRAVDRVVIDYAKVVALDHPTLPMEKQDPTRHTQRYVDVLSLPGNELRTVPAVDLAARDIKADWSLFRSVDTHTLRWLKENNRPIKTRPYVIDFAGLLEVTQFAPLMRAILERLEEAYDYPVDIEFTVNMDDHVEPKINLLQCRPLQTRGLGRAVVLPDVPDPDRTLLSSPGSFMGGNAQLPLEYVLLVRPDAYLALGQRERFAVAREIGVLNRELKGRSFMALGPGRWGTTTPSLGVPVHFTEVSNAAVLGEFTYARGDFRPELSHGSHFFADLVESGIFYVALFDDRPGVTFAPAIVTDRPNEITTILPGGGAWANVLHVARFDDLVLYSDVSTQRVLCC